MEVIEPIEIALDLWVLGLEVVFEEPCLCGVFGEADVADQVRDRQHEGRRVRFFHVHGAREYVCKWDGNTGLRKYRGRRIKDYYV